MYSFYTIMTQPIALPLSYTPKLYNTIVVADGLRLRFLVIGYIDAPAILIFNSRNRTLHFTTLLVVRGVHLYGYILTHAAVNFLFISRECLLYSRSPILQSDKGFSCSLELCYGLSYFTFKP